MFERKFNIFVYCIHIYIKIYKYIHISISVYLRKTLGQIVIYFFNRRPAGCELNQKYYFV